MIVSIDKLSIACVTDIEQMSSLFKTHKTIDSNVQLLTEAIQHFDDHLDEVKKFL